MKINALESFDTEISNIATDKSISHRFAIFSLLTQSGDRAKNYLLAEDTLNALKIIGNLGAKVKREGSSVSIMPPSEILSPSRVLECGNSGTAIRLMIRFLADVSGFFVLGDDKYLNNHPIKRICKPLSEVGVKICGREQVNLAPLCIEGQKLRAFDYKSEISSAQVETAVILSIFRTDKTSRFDEISLGRNHSENMLKAMNAPLKISDDYLGLRISPLNQALEAQDVLISNDPSSAFYFALAAIILPNSKVVLRNILLNPTRIETYKILQEMGAELEIKITQSDFETIGKIHANSSGLKAVEVKENIAWLIDETPVLAITFALTKGKSELINAKGLRVKESDRIAATVENLKLCGVNTKELKGGFGIEDPQIKKAEVKSYGDHRIAMSFAILDLLCGMEIDESERIKTSFPNSMNILTKIGARIDY